MTSTATASDTEVLRCEPIRYSLVNTHSFPIEPTQVPTVYVRSHYSGNPDGASWVRSRLEERCTPKQQGCMKTINKPTESVHASQTGQTSLYLWDGFGFWCLMEVCPNVFQSLGRGRIYGCQVQQRGLGVEKRVQLCTHYQYECRYCPFSKYHQFHVFRLIVCISACRAAVVHLTCSLNPPASRVPPADFLLAFSRSKMLFGWAWPCRDCYSK